MPVPAYRFSRKENITMKGLKLLTAILCLIAIIVPVTASCSKAPSGQAKTLKIGLITSVTGPTAPGFKGLYDAVQPTADYVNQHGGIKVNGEQYMIEIVAEDDQSSAQGAIAATNALIQKGVKFLISPLSPPNLMAMTPLAEEAKIISVNPLQIDPTLFVPENHYSFNARDYTYGVPRVYDYLQKQFPNIKKIVTLTPDDPGPNFILDLIAKETAKRGIQIVAQDKYPATTQDFYPVLTKLLEQKPDAIDGVGGITPWGVGIINQSRELGFKGPVYGAAAFGDPNQMNAMLQPQNAYDFFEVAPDVLSDKMPSIVKELRPMIEAKTGETMVMDNVFVMGALMPILQGIEKAQSFDTDAVVSAMESMSSVDTPFGKATWVGKEYVGQNHMLALDSVMLSSIDDAKVGFQFLK
jgi:branched-chain amino acid transport system substrate-binding protein